MCESSTVTREFVSLIATVKNESESIRGWLGGIECQSRLPDEIVIVDGGSTDGTWEILSAWSPGIPVTLLQMSGASISQGRNAAIDHSRGSIVAVTDAGTVARPDWLERLLDSLGSAQIDIAAGFFEPALDSCWERILAASTLPDAGEVRSAVFQPSSRSIAFRRAWWEAGVRYPEWLDYCEDLVWDLALRRAGARFEFVRDAVVAFRVRPDLRSYVLQYYRYARGDGKAGLFAKRHAIRYLAYCGLAITIRRRRLPEVAVTGCLGAIYVARPIMRLVSRNRRSGRSNIESMLLIPGTIALRGVGDVAKMAGYPAGLMWRACVFRTVGWRSAWRRITPSGRMFRPSAMTRESRPPTWLLSGESRTD